MDEKKKKNFISEKILGRELTWERALKFIGLSILCGALFALAAACVFALIHAREEKVSVETEASPEMTSAVMEESTAETESVTLPSETVEMTEEGSSAETERTAETEETESVPEASESEEASSEEMSGPEGETDTEEAADTQEEVEEEETVPVITRDTFSAAYEKIRNYLVRVDVVISETTWFESTVETRRSFSGIVVDCTEDEVQVLAPAPAVDTEDRIEVIFSDGTQKAAIAKQYSRRDGLAVISVPVAGLGSRFLEGLEVAGYSDHDFAEGEIIIAAGSPLGAAGSFDAGTVGYISEAEAGVDTMSYCAYSGVSADENAGTFLFDLDGMLGGIALKGAGEAAAAGTRIVAVSSLERIIKTMKFGEDIPFIGITGADSAEPEGMYIADVENGSPAYGAGIKRGDILILAGTREIRKVEDFLGFMKNLKSGEKVAIKILRAAGSEGYTEIELELTSGAR